MAQKSFTGVNNMSWTLSKANVSFNVRPVREWDARRRDPNMPIAGLSASARKALRTKRDREQRKVI